MMPIAERNQFAVEFYLPNGTTAEKTAQVADSMAHILQRDPQVTAVTTFIGQGSPRFHTTYAPQIGGPNFAQFIVNTVDNSATEEVLGKGTTISGKGKENRSSGIWLATTIHHASPSPSHWKE